MYVLPSPPASPKRERLFAERHVGPVGGCTTRGPPPGRHPPGRPAWPSGPAARARGYPPAPVLTARSTPVATFVRSSSTTKVARSSSPLLRPLWKLLLTGSS